MYVGLRMANGMAMGYAFSDCNVYDGQWENGHPNGFGVHTYDHSKEYRGYFSNGHPNGHGTMTYPNGNIYIGGFIDGKKWIRTIQI